VAELLAILTETAEEIEVPVPPELQGQLGPRLTTRDYLEAQGKGDARSHRVREQFEREALTGCGLHLGAPVLLIPDLAYFRDTLLSAASVTEGIIVAGTTRTSGDPRWGQDAAQALHGYHQTLLTDSQQYRSHVAHAIFQFYGDLRGQFLTQMFTPAMNAPLEELRARVAELLQLLELLRAFLCHAQLLELLKYQQVRQLLRNALSELVLTQLTQLLAVMLRRVQDTLTRPILAYLTQDSADGLDPLELLGDTVSREFVSVLGETTLWVQGHYTKRVAELLRKIHAQNRQAQQAAQGLGKHGQLGRWMQHLDEAIRLCRTLQSVPTEQIGLHLTRFVTRPLQRPTTALLSRLEKHPEYGSAQPKT
jgi:hypothetical protein